MTEALTLFVSERLRIECEFFLKIVYNFAFTFTSIRRFVSQKEKL